MSRLYVTTGGLTWDDHHLSKCFRRILRQTKPSFSIEGYYTLVKSFLKASGYQSHKKKLQIHGSHINKQNIKPQVGLPLKTKLYYSRQ